MKISIAYGVVQQSHCNTRALNTKTRSDVAQDRTSTRQLEGEPQGASATGW